MNQLQFAVFVPLFVLAASASAQTTTPTPQDDAVTERQTNKEAVIGKLKLGLGLGMVLDAGPINRIDEAQLVNGIVRVDKDSNNTIRPIFEAHMFAWELSEKVVVGPFVGVELKSGNIVNAFGAGLMTGIRISKGDETLNFGLGAFLDPSVRTLGNGIEEDAPLPVGETQIRYRQRSQWGALFVTSFGF